MPRPPRGLVPPADGARRGIAVAGDPIDLLGLPATVTVAGGTPSVRFET